MERDTASAALSRSLPQSAESQPDARTQDPSCQQELQPLPRGNSWGDRFKSTFFSGGTYFGLNFVVNTLLASTIAYLFERNASHLVKRVSKNVGTRFAGMTGMNVDKAIKGTDYGIRAFFLTSGGTALLPAIKALEEGRHGYQYRLSKALDSVQNSLGMANADTASNLADYKAIEEIAVAKSRGEKPGAAPEEIQRLEHKYCFDFRDNGDIAFREVKKSWGTLIKTRLGAILASMATNAVLGATKGNNDPKVLQEFGKYGKGFGRMETKATPWLQGKLAKYVPGFKHFVRDPELASNILFNDVILTAASSTTHYMLDGKSNGEAAENPDAPCLVPAKPRQDYRQKVEADRLARENAADSHQLGA